MGSCYITQGAQPRVLLCDDLEGWDRGGEGEAQEGGDMCVSVCICVCVCVFIHVVVQKKQTQHCKIIIWQLKN